MTRRELYEFLHERMCLCGNPEAVLGMLLRLLRWIDTDLGKPGPNWSDVVSSWRAQFTEWCPDQGTQYFLLYWLDHHAQDLTEHGGSVPGWLTKKGKDLLEALAREENDWHAFIKLHLCHNCGGDGCGKCSGEGLVS